MKIDVQINYKSVFNVAAIFLLGYAIIQYIIFSLEIQPKSYVLMDKENSVNVLIIGFASFLGLYSKRNHRIDFSLQINDNRLIIVLLCLLVASLTLSILFPWGVHGQKLELSDSLKFFTRHIYIVASIMSFVVYKRIRFKLILVDIFFLFIDPTRVLFAESVIPKFFYLFTLLSNKKTKEKVKLWILLLIVLLIVMYIQSFRHGLSILRAVNFAIYSDVIHSTYTAIQTSDFFSNYPYQSIKDFNLYYSEKKNPLGGNYLPGFFFYSGNIWLDSIGAFFVFKVFKRVLIFIARFRPMYMFSAIGIIVIMQKFSFLVLFKMLLAIYIALLIISVVVGLKKS